MATERHRARDLAALLPAVLLLLPALAAAGQGAASGSEPGAPGHTRLLFGPSGRMLEPGRGYLAIDGMLVSLNVGVTPWLSLGGGTLPLWSGGAGPPYWVIPKVRLFSRNRTSVAACVAHAVLGDDARLGLAYVVSTTGTDDRSFTVGGAVAYFVDRNDAGEDYTGAAPAFLIGGERRIHPRWSVVSENYLTTEGGVAAVGFRLHRPSFMFDFDLVAPFSFDYGAFVFPAVTMGWKF